MDLLYSRFLFVADVFKFEEDSQTLLLDTFYTEKP